MTFDPFDDFTPDNDNSPVDEQPTVADETPWNSSQEAPNVDNSSSEKNFVTVILKGGTGYEAPSISIRGEDIADANRQVRDLQNELKELAENAAQANGYFLHVYDQVLAKRQGKAKPQGQQGGGQPQAQQSKPTQQQAPNGETHTCKCGDEMKFLSGFSDKTQKPYAFFACPKPKNSQCEGNNGRAFTMNYKG